jgi:hypothetical protein
MASYTSRADHGDRPHERLGVLDRMSHRPRRIRDAARFQEGHK